jgi:glycosyltransferase involved in cell wall biosynthesis
VLSVIIPAHNSARFLSESITALEASDLPRKEWELIVVDDASTDETSRIATAADKTTRTGDTARGPAFARNAGAKVAIGEVLVFVDADVAVHTDTLRLLRKRLDDDRGLVAVFGAYDETPVATSLVSRYRNLLHHYAHRQNAGEVPTFWAGCGAVRGDAFRGAGGFDQELYKRPQIEDVELGYRLSRRGRILLDPTIQATHYKTWHFFPMMRTDFRDRAIPWVQLLLAQRHERKEGAPSLGPRAMIATAVAGLAIGSLALAVVWLGEPAYLLALGLFLLSVFLNRDFYVWLYHRGGSPLAFTAMPLHFVYLLLSAVAVPVGAALYFSSTHGAGERVTVPE